MRYILICMVALCLVGCNNKSTDYSGYMKSQSLIWEEMPLQWNEAAFTGNGHVGQMAYVDTTDNSVTLWLGRTDVTDHRGAPDRKTSMGVRGKSKFADFTRLDVGKFKIFFADSIVSGKVVQDIYNAEVSMELTTDKGNICMKVFTPYGTDLHILELKTDIPYRCHLVPGCVRPPRMVAKPQSIQDYRYVHNPDPVFENEERSGYYVQSLNAGGDYATYWEESAKAGGATILISTKNGVPEDGVALSEAKAEVSKGFRKGVGSLRRGHREWWNAYYTKGLVEIPDKKAENFYNIQLYKIGASSAQNGPAMDLMGPFYKTTQWPSIWWNLNIQLTYAGTLATNRLQQAENFARLIEERFCDVVACSKPKTAGDYIWTLQVYYQYMMYKGYAADYRYERILPAAEQLLELCSRNFREEDGTIVLADTESPEYEGFKVYDNSNYTLSNLRWLLQTLISLEEQTGRGHEKLAYWKDVLARLHPYEIGEDGLMIARDVPLAHSHRHFSHMVSFYPLHLQDISDASNRELLERTVRHWIGIDEGAELVGYTYTAAVSLLATLGDGNQAYEYLYHFLNKEMGRGSCVLLPNTFYMEGRGLNPVIETPLSAATSITDMLLQSWHGIVRVFPAVPDSWKDCAFEALRAEGGFDVSARMSGGKVEWIRIYNDAGNTCRIYLPYWHEPVVANGSKGVLKACGDGYYDVEIPQGTEIVISDRRKVEIVPACKAETYQPCHYYGVKKGMNYSTVMDWPYPQEYEYLFPKNPFM